MVRKNREPLYAPCQGLPSRQYWVWTFMSSVTLSELRTWNDPPMHSGWRSFAPVVMLDGHVYWQNKKRIEVIYQLDDVDDATEEEVEELLALLKDVQSTIDGYLRVRGTGSILLKKISLQRHSIAQAIEAIKRGYAPGKLPPEQERMSLAQDRLREIGLRPTERECVR